MTVNRIDMKTGNSVAVYKRCAEKEECDIDHIGCYESAITGVLVGVLAIFANVLVVIFILIQFFLLAVDVFTLYLQECKTCCNEDYCNEPVPFNTTSAFELSSHYISSSAPYLTSTGLILSAALSLFYSDTALQRL